MAPSPFPARNLNSSKSSTNYIHHKQSHHISNAKNQIHHNKVNKSNKDIGSFNHVKGEVHKN